jgi:Fibronectin type II domain
MSFLEFSEKDRSMNKDSELYKLESRMEEKLGTALWVNHKKKRHTTDGRMCALAFVQDRVTYYDCTTARNPAGEISSKEWCYVDPTEKGSNWGFCKSIMDYDKVREANQNYLSELTVECRKVNDEIEAYINPSVESLNYLKDVKEGQADLDNKVNLFKRDITVLNRNLLELYNIKRNWESEEINCISI